MRLFQLWAICQRSEALADHHCIFRPRSLDAQKAKHRKETLGIFTEVKHLKAVISRETTFRADLSLQKEYLLILIGQLSRQSVHVAALFDALTRGLTHPRPSRQARVYAAIAQLGYPHALVAPKRRSLKSVAIAVLMTVRARCVINRSLGSRKLESTVADDPFLFHV